MTTAVRSAELGRATQASALSQILARISGTYATWRRRTTTRFELARLDERMLQDIGVTHNAVEQEVSKPFWRA